MRHIGMLSGLMAMTMFKMDFSSLFKAPRRQQPHVYSSGEKTKQKSRRKRSQKSRANRRKR